MATGESKTAGPLHIVAIAGARASGKTSIATALAKAFGYEVRAFGDEVRRQASARGVAADRQSLRELGARLIAEWGLDEFCRRVLVDATSVTLVEGVRHLEAVSALRKIGPVTLVFIKTSQSARAARLADRLTEDLSLEAEQHSTEVEVPRLELLADLVVDGDAIEPAVLTIARHIETVLQSPR